MKVGYAVLYEDGTLTISKKHTILQKPIYKDYGEFEDYYRPWINDTDEIKRVKILNQVKSNCMKEWFDNCTNLTTLINFQNLDVSDCKDFSDTFFSCENLKNISSLKNWNVSNGIDFSGMFFGCKSLTNISTLKNWNVSNGTHFESMFRVCIHLINISELQNWNVSNGQNFFSMFRLCISLKEIHLPDTLCKLRENMFKDCNGNLKINWKNNIYTYSDLKEYYEFVKN